jgi:head-tail adaptor
VLAPKLRHRVTLQALTTTQATNGAKSEAFANWLTGEPASIYALSGRELLAANNEWPMCAYRITVRWRPGIVPSMRVIDEADPGGVVYNIRAVQPDESLRKWYTLVCEAGVNNG